MRRKKFSSESSLAMRAFPTFSSQPHGRCYCCHTRHCSPHRPRSCISRCPQTTRPYPGPGAAPFPCPGKTSALATAKGPLGGASGRPPLMGRRCRRQRRACAPRCAALGAGEGAGPPWRAGRCRRCPGNGGRAEGRPRRRRRRGARGAPAEPAEDGSPAAAASYSSGLDQPGLR